LNDTEKIKLPTDELVIEKQISTLKSLVDLYRKDKKPKKSKDVAGIHSDSMRVGKTLVYYSSIGWIQKDKGYSYTPSENLIQYFYGFDKTTASKKLVENIKNTTIGKKIFFYLSQQKDGISIDEVINYLGVQFNFLQQQKRKILRLIELLVHLDSIIIDNELIYLLENDQIKNISPLEIKEQQEVDSTDIDIFKNGINIEHEKLELKITILVDPETDEEKIRRCIRIILDEIDLRGVKE